jgi:hypothetical protein
MHTDNTPSAKLVFSFLNIDHDIMPPNPIMVIKPATTEKISAIVDSM